MMRHFVLIIFSIILYLLPYFYPYIFFWTAFPAVILLCALINVHHKKSITTACFLALGGFWCLMVVGIHLSWFWKLLFVRGKSCRILFGCITLGYFSLIMMVPFLLVVFFKDYKNYSVALFLVAFAGSLFFISHRSFLIFGKAEGYFLFNPLLPWMTLVPEQKAALNNGIIIASIDPSEENGIQRAHQLSTCIAHHVWDKKKSCLIIFPESTFPYNLEEYREFFAAWCDCHDDIHLIIGAHKQEGNATFNCAYHIHNGKIKHVYKKQHLVPFFETLPALFCEKGLGEVFTPKCKTFSYPEQNNSDIFLINEKKYQLFICSELYQDAKSVEKNMPILFIGNNSWFMMKYAQVLVQLQEKYFAWRNGCEIISSVYKSV